MSLQFICHILGKQLFFSHSIFHEINLHILSILSLVHSSCIKLSISSRFCLFIELLNIEILYEIFSLLFLSITDKSIHLNHIISHFKHISGDKNLHTEYIEPFFYNSLPIHRISCIFLFYEHSEPMLFGRYFCMF